MDVVFGCISAGLPDGCARADPADEAGPRIAVRGRLCSGRASLSGTVWPRAPGTDEHHGAAGGVLGGVAGVVRSGAGQGGGRGLARVDQAGGRGRRGRRRGGQGGRVAVRRPARSGRGPRPGMGWRNSVFPAEFPVFGAISRISTAWERHTARFGRFRVFRYPWGIAGIRGPGARWVKPADTAERRFRRPAPASALHRAMPASATAGPC